MDHRMTSTTFDVPGYRVVRSLGVVRGVTVRSRGLAGQFAAGVRGIFGGRIDEYVQLCEQTRAEAFELMVQHADQVGANAIVGIRYDATELDQNMTEVLTYGTAVVVEPA
jgi:uncharacterized protein YbjQ (UPF0145 family)